MTYVAADTLKTFKVNGLKVKVLAWSNVLAEKKLLIRNEYVDGWRS